MGTTLVSIQTTDSGETLVRRYDAAFPEGPTHQGSYSKGYQVTHHDVEKFLLTPSDRCKINYECEEPRVA